MTDLHAIAVYLAANALNTHAPTWDDVPGLTQAEWEIVSAEIDGICHSLHTIAGEAGANAVIEANR